MKLYRDGDSSKSFCSRCAKVVTTAFERRDVPFSDGKGMAKNILVGVCDACDSVVSIPAQSAPAISEARTREVASLEASLPAIYIDVLDLAARQISPWTTTDFRRPLLSFFIHQFAHKSTAARKLRRSYEESLRLFPEERGGAKRRLSLKVSTTVASDLSWLLEATDLSKTELIKSVVYEIRQQVIETPKPNYIKELQAIATYA